MFSPKKLKLIIVGSAIVGIVVLRSLTSLVLPQPFKIAFLDVGQGDSILIRTENGQNILIDGGPDKTVLYKLEKYLPWYDRTIDAVILTHPHADHLIGLIEVMKRYKVDRVISTGIVHTTPEYLEWLNLIKEKKIPAESFKKGDKLTLDNGASLTSLWPEVSSVGKRVEDINNTSLVLLLQTPDAKILLMGDAEEPIEESLIKEQLDLIKGVNILKVGHQGSRNGTSEEFLKAAKPKFAVIFAGINNRFGHPHLETLKRLHDSGAQILRTDERGDVVFVENKRALRLK